MSNKNNKKKDEQALLFDRKELEETLTTALNFVPKHWSIPILDNVYLEARDSICRIAATNLERSFVRKIPYNGDSITTCIPAEIFFKEIKALESEVENVKLQFIHKRTVRINCRCDINTLDTDGFPTINNDWEKDSQEVKIEGLADKIKRVVTVLNVRECGTNGVLLDTANGRVVANDGKRLHLDDITSYKDGQQIILPAETAAIITKYPNAEKVKISRDLKHFSVEISSGVMTSTLIEGTYPKYEEVIPKDNPIKVTFKGKDFLKVMEGVLPITTQEYQLVKLTVNGKLEIATSVTDKGNYGWYIPCKSEGKGKGKLDFGFNARYLIDAVRAYTTKDNDTIRMELKDNETACIINSKAIIMPMILND